MLVQYGRHTYDIDLIEVRMGCTSLVCGSKEALARAAAGDAVMIGGRPYRVAMVTDSFRIIGKRGRYVCVRCKSR